MRALGSSRFPGERGGMYSAPAVGSKFKTLDEVVGQSVSQRAIHEWLTGSGPIGCRRGPGGNRTCLAMYSAPAVECVLRKSPTRKRAFNQIAQQTIAKLGEMLRPMNASSSSGGASNLWPSSQLDTSIPLRGVALRLRLIGNTTALNPIGLRNENRGMEGQKLGAGCSSSGSWKSMPYALRAPFDRSRERIRFHSESASATGY